MELAIATGNSGLPAHTANLRPFPPGTSGNPTGRPKTSFIRRKLMKQLRQEIAAGVDRADCIADGMIEKAITDVNAAAFIRDTVDGRPQSSGDTGVAIANNVTVELVYVGGSE